MMLHQGMDCASCQCPISMLRNDVEHTKKTHYDLCILAMQQTGHTHTEYPSPNCHGVKCLAYKDISSNVCNANPVILSSGMHSDEKTRQRLTSYHVHCSAAAAYAALPPVDVINLVNLLSWPEPV